MKSRAIILFLSIIAVVVLSGCGDRDSTRIDMSKKEKDIGAPVEKTQDTIRFAVGAMLTPKEGFGYYRGFLDYVGKKVGRNIEYVDKTSYEEINEALKSGNIDAAFVCSGPYVDGRIEFGLQPLVAPQAHGESVYYSYIIVPIDSKAATFDDLKGKTFAFADPQSNSGCLVPTYMLARQNETPDTFFKSFIYTYAHDKSIQAVAQKVVDGAAVDSLIWEYAAKTNPVYTSKTRILLKSPPHGIPPVVIRAGFDPVLRRKLEQVFLNAHLDEEGEKLLDGMMIERFVTLEDGRYDSIREMKKWIKTVQEIVPGK